MTRPSPAKTQLLSLSVAALAAATGTASAQQAPIPLPGIVIQGATLEKPPVAQRRTEKPADEVAPTAAPKPTPPPSNSTAATTPAATATAAAAASALDVQAAAPTGPLAGALASDIGAAVTVITSNDIQQQQARTAADVLRGAPGVVVNDTGSVGGVTTVQIRGANARDTRVIVDGVEVNTTKDSFYDFSNLSPEDIERIEIIRGPMSALYGSGAAGGVINIETKAARGPLSLSVRAEGGSFGTKDLAGRLAAGDDSGFFSITAQDRKSLGFVVAPGGSIHQGTDLQTYGLHAGVTVAPAAKLDVTVRYTDKHADFTDFGADTVTPFASKPYLTADDANNLLIERSLLAGVRFAWDSLGGALTQQVKSNYTSDVSGNRFMSDPTVTGFPTQINTSRDGGTRFNSGYLATYRFPVIPGILKQSVSGQLERQTETFTPYSDFGTTFGNYNGDGVTRSRNQLSAAGEWRGTIGERLTLSFGARRDVNATFQNFTTWRTSASFDWKEWALRPHASLGTGVKLPGMYDQFGANTIQYEANPGLLPETSRGFDVGVGKKFFNGQLLADITYFGSTLQNKIDGFGFDPQTGQSFAENLPGLSRRRGVEVSTQYQINRALYVGAAYTYTDSENPNSTPVVRVVPHGLKLDVRYLFDDDKGTLSLAAINNSRTPDIAFLNDGSFASTTVDLAPYWKLQLAASYKIQPNVELYGRIENALSARYQEVYGYNTAGVAAYAGVKFKFDDLLGTGKK